LVYIIAALQFGTVFVLAMIFWAGPIVEKLWSALRPAARLRSASR